MHIPRELLLRILRRVHKLYDYVSVARTSRSLFDVLMHPAFLNHALKKMSSTPSGCLFWLRPVSDMPGDEKNATPPLLAWLNLRTKSSGALTTPIDSQSEGRSAVVGGTANRNTHSTSPILHSPLDEPSFPYLQFVRSCFESESMKNRRRLWGQVKQMEKVWGDYRAYGWKVNRFGVPLKDA